MRQILCAAILGPSLAVADPFDVSRLAGADVIVVGEVHDNAAHHVFQAEITRAVSPAAIVMEMLTPEEAGIVADPFTRDGVDLAEVLAWDRSGWPPFDMYAPVFEALGDAQLYGGEVERSVAQSTFAEGAAAAFDGIASGAATSERFGLNQPLPENEQAVREALQLDAHCGMLPPEMLPPFVEAQRLRDAVLASSTLMAFEAHGGPIVVITGNGHARTDWGIPAVLAVAAPDLRVMSIGQIEGGETSAPFDIVIETMGVDRPDPCVGFEN